MNGFLTELLTQGDVLKRVVDFYKNDGAKLIEAVYDEYKKKGMNRVIMTGMGSSLYAMDTMKSYLTQHGIPCNTYTSHELENYQFGQINEKTLIIAISQSGNSQEVIQLVEKAKNITTVVGIYNNEGCKLEAMADFLLPIKADKEVSITSKTYEVTMLILNILGRKLTDTLDAAFWDDVDKTVNWIADWILNWEKPANEMASFADGVVLFDLLANNTSLATARQLSLAYREGLHNPAAVWELADYAHGQYHSSKMQDKYLAQIFNPVLAEGTKDHKMFHFILDHGGKVMVYSPGEVPALPNVFAVKMPDVPDTLLPLAESVASECMLGVLFGESWIKDH